jgi:hypothetical protein
LGGEANVPTVKPLRQIVALNELGEHYFIALVHLKNARKDMT